jgi:hypothetical protein
MNNQRGIAISGLIFWGIVIALVAVLGMKVGPEYMDYYKILKSVKSISAESSGKTVPEIRAAFDRYADVNYINTIKGADLDISKDANGIVIAFAFERRIPLFYNVSLLIDFEGSSTGRE